jgi:DNA polymerase III delta subunit
MIYRHFLTLYKIILLRAQNHPFNAICAQLKLSRFFFREYQDEAALWETEDFSHIFESLFSADRSLKTGKGVPALILSRLGFSICRIASSRNLSYRTFLSNGRREKSVR